MFFKKVKVTQLCLTLCDPMDYTVRGTLQACFSEMCQLPPSRLEVPSCISRTVQAPRRLPDHVSESGVKRMKPKKGDTLEKLLFPWRL